MKQPHKAQAAAMDRAGELMDGELSMSMFVSREDYERYLTTRLEASETARREAMQEAARYKADAERYRFLRMDAGIRDGRPFIAKSCASGISQWTGIFADKQVDDAIATIQQGEQNK